MVTDAHAVTQQLQQQLASQLQLSASQAGSQGAGGGGRQLRAPPARSGFRISREAGLNRVVEEVLLTPEQFVANLDDTGVQHEVGAGRCGCVEVWGIVWAGLGVERCGALSGVVVHTMVCVWENKMAARKALLSICSPSMSALRDASYACPCTCLPLPLPPPSALANPFPCSPMTQA